jgi:hypothetical protein
VPKATFDLDRDCRSLKANNNVELLDMLQITISHSVDDVSCVMEIVMHGSIESSVASVLTESLGLHALHLCVELATDKYRVFGWRRLGVLNPDFGYFLRADHHVNLTTRRIEQAIHMSKDRVAKLSWDAEKCSLMWRALSGS